MWRARATAPVLAVAAVACWPVDSHAQANTAPVITAPADRTYEQGQAITAFAITVTDADADPVTVTVTGLPSGLSHANGQVQGTVAGDATAQAYTVTVGADDGVNALVDATFTVTVTEPAASNAAPVITAPGDKTYEQGQAITAFGITVTDADADPVTVTVTGLPSGLSFANGQVQGTVAADAAAQAYTVTVGADDGVNAAVEATFTVTVTEPAAPNAAPVITAPGDKTYEQGQAITAFGITVTDADADPVTVTVTGLPSGLSYSNGQVQGTVAATAAAQAYTVTVGADDGVNAAVEATFTVTVTEPAASNAAPVITAPGDKTYEQGEAIAAFAITVTDADGDDVTVTVTGLPSGLSFANGQVQGTVAADAAAQAYTVTVGADDGVNAAVEATFTVTVTEPAASNAAPVITAPGDKTYEQGEAITAFGITVTDADGDDVTVTVTGLPSGLSFANGQVQGTVAADAAAQAYTVTGGADDGVNAAVEATFTVTVTEPAAPNAAPVITAPADKTYEQGEAIAAFAITVTDADGDDVTVTVTGLPSGLSFANGQVQGTVAADAAAPQAYTVTISADDRVNAVRTATFTITVTAPREMQRPTVTISGPTVPQRGAFNVRIAFSEPVTGFEQGDVTVGNGFVREFSGSGARYTAQVRITPGFSGTVTVDVAGNVAEDAAGEPNAAASRFSVEGDQTRPTVTISGPTGLQTGPFDVTFTFSESVTGFEQGDVTVGNGSVTAFSGSGLSYTATIAPADAGTVTVDVAAHVATDATGNPNLPASRYSVQAEPASNAAPVITDPADKTYERGETITAFGITVTDADGDDVTVTVTGLPSGLSYSNGQVQGAVAATAAAQAYTVTIGADDAVNAAVTATFTITVTETAPAGGSNSPPVITGPGNKTYERGETITAFGITVSDTDGDSVTVTVTGLPSGLTYTNGQVQGTVGDDAVVGDHSVTIQADDGGDAPAIETFTITVRAAQARQRRDQTRPTVDITGPTGAQKGAFKVTITFSESVTGFEQAEVTVGNGTVTSFAGTGSVATVFITPTASGTVTVDVAENVATDGDGDGNTAATRYSVEADLDAPTVTISGPTTSQSGPFDVTITFSEAVTGFEKAEVTVGNGTVTAFSGSGSSYAVSIAPTVAGTVTVDVAAGVAVDGAGNGNTAASRLSVSVSVSRPTTTFESDADPFREGPFQVRIIFQGPVTGFEESEVTVTNAHTGPLTLMLHTRKYSAYYIAITPKATGTVTVDVAANVAVDEHGNGNTAASRLSVPVSVTQPQPVITAPTGVQIGPFEVTVTFSESVTGFEKSDIGVEGGSVTAFSGSGATYTATITPTVVTGTVKLLVNRHAAVDADENKSTAAVSVQVSVDRTVPAAPTLTRTRFSKPTKPALDVTWSAPAAGGETITGYEARHRRSGDAWTNYAGALGASSTSFNVPDLEPGAAYEAQVRALRDGVPGPWSRIGSGRANSPPRKATYPPQYPTLTVSWKDVHEYRLRGQYDDADGDSFTYSVESLDPGFIEASISGGSVFVRILNPGNAKIRITAYDSYGGVGPTLLPNYFGLARITLSVPENSPAGTAVGAPVVGLPYNGEALSYWLSDPAPGDTMMSDFVVDAASGQIKVKQGAALDYETKRSYTGRTNWGMIHGRKSFALLTVNVTDADDDDASPAVTIADASAAEGDEITFTVRLDKAVSKGLTVTPSFTGGSATKGTDYAENTADLTFTGTAGETKTFTVATTEDADSEPDETFTVGLNLSKTTETVTATDTATGTILDDDTAELTIADASSAEGDSMTFTVTLDKAVSGGLTVTPSFTDGTATEGTDYTENPAAITFNGTAGETKTFTVATTEDADHEEDETFTVSLAVSGTQTTVTATDTATGTINDDDDGPAVFIDHASAAEGDSITFTVTLDQAVSGGLTVTPGFTDGTATEGTDYTENTAAIRFTGTAGETQTFTVATTEDTDAELDETFIVNLVISGTTTAVTATDTATGTITNDDGAVPAVTIEDASAAEGDSITFTVTLDMAVSGGLTVTPAFTDETATEGTDYTENTDALTFTGTAGEEQTFSVATHKDEDNEDDETFTVSLTVSGTSATVASDTATGTVTDDNQMGRSPAVVTVADASADEGDSMTFTVTLDKAVSGGLTVTPSFTDVTATEGTDYTENAAALTFTGTAGETQTFTVATTEDTEGESDETFTVGLAVSGLSGTETVTATDTATGTIVDDESPAVSIADASASEGDSLTFTVTLDKAVSGGLTVTPSFTDGTATKGTDYTENTAALTFTGTAGETQTFTVATTEDADAELDETFTVDLTVTTAATPVAATDTATGTITNDDGAVPAVTIEDASAAEGDSITFTVTLDMAVSGGLTVTPAFTDGTATQGTDYTENTAALTFTGTAGETQTFTVATTEDADAELDETFTVDLTVSGTQAPVAATDTATGTITNDDGAVAAVTIEDASAAEGDSLTFTVTLDKAVSGGLTVTPAFTDGTATEGTDYTENKTALTFTGTAGETQTFTVATIEDTDAELDETFTVSLAVSGTQATVTATDTATGTITNDDGALSTVTIDDASAGEGDSMTFKVTLDKAVSGGLTVTPAFTDGTATEGTDYTENKTALTFTGTAGETQTFTVATIEDADAELDETFTVSLAVSGTQATVTATDTATGTITNDDGALSTVTIDDASASEGDLLAFIVTLDKAVSGGLTVTPSFTDGTAAEGTDYTENTAALSFTGTAGETQTFTVATIEDADAELDETFTVSLAVSGTQAPVTATDTATGTITNDDGALSAVTIGDASASEGDSMAFTVTLANAVPEGLTVTPSFTDGTATEGTDYTENTAALSFAGTAGETQTFTVATIEDADAENDETFTVNLAVSGTQATVTATDAATGTVTDDDGDGNGTTPAVTVADATAGEGDSMTFTVTLDKAVSDGLTVTPSFTDGTATEGTDYTENTAALSFTGTAGETQSFTVATIEDADAENDETFTVNLAVSGTQATVTATDTATGTITNDDGALSAVTIGDASASEGDSLTFTVMLDKAVSGGLTVTPSFTDGTAAEGTDYTENTAALSFAGTAGETQTFTVPTIEDADAENDETFTVSLAVSEAQAPVTATDTATGTITNDDGALAAVTIGDASASEGDSMTFTATLDNAVPGGLTVTPSFTDGTATEGTDYTENTAALGFAGMAGETQRFAVATIEDADAENDETFTVSLAVSGTQATVTATDTATGTINDDGDGNGTAPAVTVADAWASEGDSMTFTVTLHGAVSGGLTVTPGFTDDTATKGTDYTENTAAITFAGTDGETRTFTVATTEDEVVEGAESFIVDLTVSGTSETVDASDAGTGTIDDDDGVGSGSAAAVTVADASASEGDSMTFTVTLHGAVPGGLTVAPGFTDGTATESTDYVENRTPLTFTGTTGETRTFTVATTDDTDDEPDETFTVSLNVSGTTATVTATRTGTGTILDDDAAPVAPAATLTIADAAASEGDALTFAVTLDGEIPGGFTVTPELAEGTATADEDYRAEPQALRFAGSAGESRTFSVPTVEDAVEEGDEAFTVSLAVSGTTAAVTAAGPATGLIEDDDLTPVLLRVAPSRVSEAAGPTTIEVTAAFESGASLSKATAVRVTVGAPDDAAVPETDYASPASFTVTIPAGSTAGSSTFTLEPVNDTLLETDEALAVTGDAESRPVTGTSVALQDDDAAAARLVVRLEPDVVPENAGPTTVTVVAEIVGATPTAPLPVTMRVGGHDDTADPTIDYEAVDAFTVLIPAGSTQESATFILSPIEDDLIEGDESLTLTGKASRLAAASDQGTIRDEDLAEVRAEGTGRTLFLLARAIGSESLAAIEERFAGTGVDRRARLGRLPTLGPGAAAGWSDPFAGAGGSFAGTATPGAGPGMPGVAGAGAAGPFGTSAGLPAGAGAPGAGAPGMGLSMPSQPQPFDALAWLDGASFAAPLGSGPATAETPADNEARWVVWGRAASTRTTVQATPGAQARGDLFTMHAGVDTRMGSRGLLGVAVSNSQGKMGYTLGARPDAEPAVVEGGVTSVQPYALWAPRAGLEVWGLGGSGRGPLRVSDAFGTVDTDVRMRLAAGGVRQALTSAGGLSVKGDVFHAVLTSGEQADLPAARATAARARLLLEWKSEWASSAARISPRLELGGRWDGGSDVDGLGSEVGGGISLAHVGLGLELAGAGRYLLAHQAAGFEEWGASIALRAGPGVTNRGPWMSIEPEWGAASSRMQALWGPQADPGLHPGGGVPGAQPGRLRLATGYALPEAGADVRLEAMRESRDPQAGPQLGVRFSATLNW